MTLSPSRPSPSLTGPGGRSCTSSSTPPVMNLPVARPGRSRGRSRTSRRCQKRSFARARSKTAAGPPSDPVLLSKSVLARKRHGPPSETCTVRKSWLMRGPQRPSSTGRSDADDVEAHACPKCEAQPGSLSAHAAVSSPPRNTPAASRRCPAEEGTACTNPGRPWRPGTPPPAPVGPDLPGADLRIGYAHYAHCSTLDQGLDSSSTRSQGTASPGTRSSARRPAPAYGPGPASRRRCGPRGRSRPTPRTAGSSSPCTR